MIEQFLTPPKVYLDESPFYLLQPVTYRHVDHGSDGSGYVEVDEIAWVIGESCHPVGDNECEPRVRIRLNASVEEVEVRPDALTAL